MAVGRRAVLGAMGLALAGCAGGRSAGLAPPATPSASGGRTAATGASEPRQSVRSAQSAQSGERETVVARYAGIRPSTWGTDVAGVVTQLPSGTAAIALTFDACGGPGGSGYDAALIELLRSHRVAATLFLNARWIDANPAVFHDLAADPLFEIGNHGTSHRPLSVDGRSAYGISGTRDVGEAYDEVAGDRAKLAALVGRPPRFFRSGTAHYDEVATRIVADLGEQVAGFTVNGDAGATFTAEQVRTTVGAARPGAIVISHLNQPAGGTARGYAAALPALLDAGRTFTRLSDALP
ncbi:polysaccharide deacetylase family protein [Kitasatospora cinereorecta]|uniref:Polysaccharide deacetylase family protein n=1 Tax=Kitasatospora cinereorecta TaxID=285560 RepID=A0ABW0V7J4_9ACTN